MAAEPHWHALDAGDALAAQGSRPAGLSTEEALALGEAADGAVVGAEKWWRRRSSRAP